MPCHLVSPSMHGYWAVFTSVPGLRTLSILITSGVNSPQTDRKNGYRTLMEAVGKGLGQRPVAASVPVLASLL